MRAFCTVCGCDVHASDPADAPYFDAGICPRCRGRLQEYRGGGPLFVATLMALIFITIGLGLWVYTG